MQEINENVDVNHKREAREFCVLLMYLENPQ